MSFGVYDRYVRVPSEEELVSLLESLDLKDRKDALQVVCNALEAGMTLRLENNLLLASLIARQRHSSDEVLRRWFYKYVGLVRAHSYLPWLLGQLTIETDLQTLAWLAGAIVALLGPANALAELRHKDLPDDIARDALIYGAYFRPELIDTHTVERLTNADTFLINRWATFLNARWREKQLSEYVRELGEHPDAEVAEFALWSAMKQGTNVGETLLDPDKISEAPAAVRRWAYHLIAADNSARIAYSDLILRARTDEHDERAREGLAAGLIKARLDGRWLDFANDWRRNDPSERVKRVLRSGLVHTVRSTPHARVFQAAAKKADEPSGQRRSSMKGVPKVVESRREMMYLIAVDTIAFSEASDGDQLSIARNILEEFSVQQELVRLNTD